MAAIEGSHERMSRVQCAHALVWMAFMALAPAVSRAQTSGSLRGMVIDDRGGPLAGVSIVVASAAQGISGRGALTDASGTFQIGSLPPAPDYFIRAVFPGYAPLDLSHVEIRPGQTTPLRLVLQPETSLRERIEVRASPQIVNLESTTTETRLSSEFIDSLPILGRNYQDVLALAPGVTDTDGDGNPNIHGARDTDVVTLVDGVSTSDPLTGKIGAQLNIESIQEIEVKTSGAGAEYSRAQGGFANIITKSGGNDFQGTFKFYWRGSRLDGDGAGIDDPRLHGGFGEQGLRELSFNDFLPFLSLEGPILRDHAWFFLANEYVREEEPINAVNRAFVAGTRELREFAKLTWQATVNHRLALSINYDPQTYLNQGLNSLTDLDSGFTTKMGGPIVTLKATSILSPNVALESSAARFDERPTRLPTLDPDTNHNGVLFEDRNHDGFIEATERDSGEDFDGDGTFDIFEDSNRNGQLDPDEDRDGDGRLTMSGDGDLPGACEGAAREDLDCDGRIDTFNEDVNGNGRLDPLEDIDGDRHLDLGNEDRNGNNALDDTPRPAGPYPYGELRPRPADRDYTIDQSLGLTAGPYYQDFSDKRTRLTLRQDLSVYVPDYWGSHDLKFGGVAEKEDFDRETDGRPIVAPVVRDSNQGPSTVRVLLPAETNVDNSGRSLTAGLYAQETYKPFPNMTLGFGVRFDRETIDTFGYSFFDPAVERADYDRLIALSGGERALSDFLQGNNDGLISGGYCADPIFYGPGLGNPCTNPVRPTGADPERDSVARVEQDLAQLQLIAPGRMTRHHTETLFTLSEFKTLFPDVIVGGEVDPRRLAAHDVLPQQKERFRLTNNNLAPRLSFSWDPGSRGRSKVFATWGRYFDKLFLNTVVGEEGPDTVNRYYLLDPSGITGNGTPDHRIGRILSKSPPSTTQVDRGLQTPFSDELTLGFERELAPEIALSLTYIHRSYRQQLQDIDVNHTLRPDPRTGLPRDDLGAVQILDDAGDVVAPPRTSRLPDGRPDLYIQDFFFNQVLRIGNYNQARYNGLELSLLKRLARRWELQGSYTYSRAVGDAEDFESRVGNDPSTVESESGYLDYDQRHIVKLSTTHYLPGDWQVGTSVAWASGLPWSVVSRFFALDNADYQQYRTRYGGTQIVDGHGRFVTERRNDHRNDASLDVNLRAKKTLVIGKRSSALFLEVFNLLNRDDLRIFTYEPDRTLLSLTDRANVVNPLQIDATRKFGRRFQVGFQIEF